MAQAIDEQGHHPSRLPCVTIARRCREAQAREQQLSGIRAGTDGTVCCRGIEQAAQRRRELADDMIRKRLVGRIARMKRRTQAALDRDEVDETLHP